MPFPHIQPRWHLPHLLYQLLSATYANELSKPFENKLQTSFFIQIATQTHALHGVVMSLWSHFIRSCASVTDISPEQITYVSNVLRFRFVWCFLVCSCGLCVFDRNSTEACPSQCITAEGASCPRVSSWMLTLSSWRKWVSASFLCYEVTTSLFVISKYWGEILWDYVNILLTFIFSHTAFSISWWFSVWIF